MRSVFGLVLGLACSLSVSCTVDLGPDTGPPQQCNAPSDFFLSDVWPKFFEAYMCGQSQCHDASNGKGYFRVQNVSAIPAPAPGTPVTSWPNEWQNNLRAVQRNVSCANPLQSNVLIVPSGRGQKHPPGNTVTDVPGADALFSEWLAK